MHRVCITIVVPEPRLRGTSFTAILHFYLRRYIYIYIMVYIYCQIFIESAIVDCFVFLFGYGNWLWWINKRKRNIVL